MIEHDVRGRGAFSETVLEALRRVPREAFVPEAWAGRAYEDRPLPIGGGQTISQPYIVAVMTEWASLDVDDRVLEIGTGSGYQAAVLAQIVRSVCTVERIPALARAARLRFAQMGLAGIDVRTADGYDGWPAKAPFDAILVTAALPVIPPPLPGQLRPGGRLVMPVGEPGGTQYLVRHVVQEDGVLTATCEMPVRFVPFMRGLG